MTSADKALRLGTSESQLYRFPLKRETTPSFGHSPLHRRLQSTGSFAPSHPEAVLKQTEEKWPAGPVAQGPDGTLYGTTMGEFIAGGVALRNVREECKL